MVLEWFLIKYYQRNEIQDLEENNINDFYELQEEISSNQENEIKQEKIEEEKSRKMFIESLI